MNEGFFDAPVAPRAIRLVKYSSDIADIINGALEKKGLSIPALAASLKIPVSKAAQYLSGTHNFTLEEIVDLELALDIVIIPCLAGKSEE
jgi:ribosome-binding protein aMBF1 (putative translation factor)